MLTRKAICGSLVTAITGTFITINTGAEMTTSSNIPPKYDEQWVMCRTENVRVIGNRKEKQCDNIPWSTSKGDTPSATEIFYWRDIYITAYKDNKTIRFTFKDMRAGWQLSNGEGYAIKVYLLDANFASLITGGVLVYPSPGKSRGYIPPLCNVKEPNEWRNIEYEFQLKGADQRKYDDIKHMVFTLSPWAGGVGYTRC